MRRPSLTRRRKIKLTRVIDGRKIRGSRRKRRKGTKQDLQKWCLETIRQLIIKRFLDPYLWVYLQIPHHLPWFSVTVSVLDLTLKSSSNIAGSSRSGACHRQVRRYNWFSVEFRIQFMPIRFGCRESVGEGNIPVYIELLILNDDAFPLPTFCSVMLYLSYRTLLGNNGTKPLS